MLGRTLENYEILDELGAGGMGVVYRARDLRLDRIVALKFLPGARGMGATERGLLLDEARAASSLDHPHIATVYEVDETQEGQPFIAMACYEGETLKARLARGPIPVDEALAIAIQAAKGLARLHREGLVHRDIKPANLFLTREGVVKILDFGLAKLASSNSVAGPVTTAGTVAYSAPEQLRSEPPDPRTDVWSLAVTLYEMVSGELPFDGDAEQALVFAIASEPPQPLDEHVDAPGLQHVLATALAKDCDARYPTVVAFHEALEALVTDASSRALRHRQWVSAAALVVAMAVLGWWWSVGALEHGPPAPDSRRVAVLSFVAAEPDVVPLADRLTDGVVSNLSRGSGLSVLARSSTRAYQEGVEDLAGVGRALSAGTLVTGTVRRREDELGVELSLFDASTGELIGTVPYLGKAEDLTMVELRLAAGVASRLERYLSRRRDGMPSESRATTERANFFLARRTPSSLGRAVELYEESLTAAPQSASAMAGLAHAFVFQSLWGDRPGIEGRAEERAMAEQALELDAELPAAHAALAWVLGVLERDYVSALEEFETALAANPDDPMSQEGYAYMLALMGDVERAERALLHGLDRNPVSRALMVMEGHLVHAGGRHAEAVEQFEGALELDPADPIALSRLGLCLLELSREEAGVAALERASELAEHHPSFVARLAYGYAHTGWEAEARRLLAQLENGARTPEYELAALELALGDGEAALSRLERAERSGSPALVELLIDPRFRELHPSPPFRALMNRLRPRWPLDNLER